MKARRNILLGAVLWSVALGLAVANPASARDAVSAGHDPGRTFYLDADQGDDANDGRAPQRAWRSLARLEAAPLQPGDRVAFRRGATFPGRATIAASGTARRPIVVTAYGAGAAPVLTNPGGLHMLYVTGEHVRIANLHFAHGVTFDNADGAGIRGPKYERSGAVAIATGADDVTVAHNEFVAVGLGVKSYGLRTRIEHNTFRDLTIAFRGIDSGSETSYGALGVSLNNSDADVGWNTFVNCRSTDSPYGADGGAVEIEGFAHTKDDIRIHHNFSSGSQGFVEVTETSTTDVEIAYNVSDDYQQFLAFDTTTTPRGYRVWHNTVLRRSSRNNTAAFAVFFYRDEGPLPSADWLSIRDNVFYTPAAKVLRGSYTYKPFEYPHDHNVLTGQVDPLGYPLGQGDVIADPRFAGDVPELPSFIDEPADVRLRADSPAIDRAATRPADVDILGQRVPRGRQPDAGAIEFTGRPRPRPDDPPVPGENLLADAGFELQPGGAPAAPWTDAGPGQASVVSGAGGDAHAGSAFARITGSSSGFTLLGRVADVQPGQPYRLRVWLRTGGTICDTCLYYGVKTLSGQVVREFIATNAGAWTALDVDFTPSTSQVFLQVGYYGTAADRVDTDDWSLAALE